MGRFLASPLESRLGKHRCGPMLGYELWQEADSQRSEHTVTFQAGMTNNPGHSLDLNRWTSESYK